MNGKARLELHRNEKVAWISLAAPKANILDREMVGDLDNIFAQLEERRDLCSIVIASDGPHFSFGASVEEHLPDQIANALARLGGLLRRIAAAPAPTIAAVRGQCLGGGFELVLACDLIVAEEEAQFGAPEIKLAVFPPAASALLPVRIGAAPAAAMTLTGRSFSALEMKARGLVTLLSPTGGLHSTVDSFIEENFLARSPAALRHACTAIRRSVVRALDEELPELDRLYLEQLMSEPDAIEGIRAFLEKRQPQWKAAGVAV
jgi:cyclohexa-1,5-dienecarbonyl-CoA hydratase